MPVLNPENQTVKTWTDVVKNELWIVDGYCRKTVTVTVANTASVSYVVGDLLQADGSPVAAVDGSDIDSIFLEAATGESFLEYTNDTGAPVDVQIVVLDKAPAIVIDSGLSKSGAALTTNPTPAQAKTALEAKGIKVSNGLADDSGIV